MLTGIQYGQGFSQNGGGVYALEWTDTGLGVWFFPRSSVPSDLSSNSPDPSSWGLPTAYYPTSSCDLDTFFQPQTLILDITVCGAFAIGAFSETCSGNCLDLVQHPKKLQHGILRDLVHQAVCGCWLLCRQYCEVADALRHCYGNQLDIQSDRLCQFRYLLFQSFVPVDIRSCSNDGPSRGPLIIFSHLMILFALYAIHTTLIFSNYQSLSFFLLPFASVYCKSCNNSPDTTIAMKVKICENSDLD